jgi:hypothetical protein
LENKLKKENNHSLINRLLALVLGFSTLTLVACAPSPALPKTALDDQPPRMVSAFFGLDNGIQAFWYKGADGMPVTFSKRVQDPDALDPEMFTVITRSGVRAHPLRVTTRPANAATKRHSVLMIGEFGNEPSDPPVKVEITGHLILAGSDDAHGLSAQVTPLADGPSLVLAYAVSPKDFAGDFPPETKQIVVTVWNGGVEPMDSVTYKNHLQGYSVETSDGNIVLPIGLGDIGGDNYEYLYLDTESTALRVSMKSNLLMDPRLDGNPATSIEVAGASVLNDK